MDGAAGGHRLGDEGHGGVTRALDRFPDLAHARGHVRPAIAHPGGVVVDGARVVRHLRPEVDQDEVALPDLAVLRAGRGLEVRVGGVVVHGHDAGVVAGEPARGEAGHDERLDLALLDGHARGQALADEREGLVLGQPWCRGRHGRAAPSAPASSAPRTSAPGRPSSPPRPRRPTPSPPCPRPRGRRRGWRRPGCTPWPPGAGRAGARAAAPPAPSRSGTGRCWPGAPLSALGSITCRMATGSPWRGIR